MAEANKQIMEMFMTDEQKAERLERDAIFKRLFDKLPRKKPSAFLNVQGMK